MIRSRFLLFIAGASVLYACPQYADDPCRGTQCGGIVDGGPDVVVPPGCEVEPSKKADCVTDANGVFVSAGGNDDALGTTGAPVKSITKALAIASSGSKPWVFVCEGNYAETVTIARGVGVYGGLACAGWGYTGGPTSVKPEGAGPVLTINDTNDSVTVSDLDIEARGAATPGGSSIVAFAANAGNVMLRRVKLTAGNGVTATPGVTGTNYAGAIAANGQAPTGATGGPGGTATCTDGTTSGGGKGGNGVADPVTARDGLVGTSDPAAQTSAGRDGAGGKGGTTTCGQGATPGADGAPKPAAQGAQVLGVLTAAGWTPQVGGAGGNGEPGQGGGGGGATTTPVQGGGGGGAGGCGGAGGPGGAAGGSSFALLSFQSSVHLEASTLRASDAGNGADGAQGGKGQAGGDRNTEGACQSNRGGNGAGGGGGGGGAGGLSVSIGHVGNGPTVDAATTMTKGAAGAFGKGASGGDPGSNALGPGKKGNPGGDGKPGEAAEKKDLTI